MGAQLNRQPILQLLRVLYDPHSKLDTFIIYSHILTYLVSVIELSIPDYWEVGDCP